MNQCHNILISRKPLLMREKAIRLATAGEDVIFICDSRREAKTLLHYNLKFTLKMHCRIAVEVFLVLTQRRL